MHKEHGRLHSQTYTHSLSAIEIKNSRRLNCLVTLSLTLQSALHCIYISSTKQGLRRKLTKLPPVELQLTEIRSQAHWETSCKRHQHQHRLPAPLSARLELEWKKDLVSTGLSCISCDCRHEHFMSCIGLYGSYMLRLLDVSKSYPLSDSKWPQDISSVDTC